jgi:tripartite-type tricarboxylate transporter receptor subunit TctC
MECLTVPGIRLNTLLACGVVLAAAPAAADEASDFYAGRNVTIVIGYGAGGGADTYGRFLARHLGDFIPGKPNVIVQNMPGAGGLKATNYVYAAAPKDGAVLTMVQPYLLLEPMLGNRAARWEVPKFTWLGSLSRDVNSCVASGRSGIKSIRDAESRQIVVGTTGPSAMDMKAPVTLAKVLGYNLKFVSGYTGSDTAHMALETGEIDAYCAFWASLAMGKQKQNIDRGVFVPIVQFGSKPHPAFGDAPVVYDLARSDEQTKILKFIFKSTEFGRITLAPPGVPAARAKILRESFWAAATSDQLRKDAERRKMAIDPMTAEETEKTLLDLVDAPQAIVDRAIASMHR